MISLDINLEKSMISLGWHHLGSVIQPITAMQQHFPVSLQQFSLSRDYFKALSSALEVML